MHDATDQHHLVLLPKPPRERKHPHDEAAEFFNHMSDPETGLRELNIALPPGWMSMQLDRLKDKKDAPGRLLDLARRAWSCWNGLSGADGFVVLAFGLDDVDRLEVASDPEEEPDDAERSGLSGYVGLGRLRLPRTVAEKLRCQAQARGLTPPSLAREWLAERILSEPASGPSLEP
jgi:hypothetical protein